MPPTEAQIQGHPATPLYDEAGAVKEMLTVCSSCGQLRTILFLDSDRWYCANCRAEGGTKPKMFPIS